MIDSSNMIFGGKKLRWLNADQISRVANIMYKIAQENPLRPVT